jgi:hypothetical protein
MEARFDKLEAMLARIFEKLDQKQDKWNVLYIRGLYGSMDL